MVDFRNPNGAVCILDGGIPRTITIKARANISGGYWVNGSSATGVVGSGAETYAASDIEGYPVSTVIGSEVIGLAITDIASGTYGTIAQRGVFLLPGASGTAIGSIYAGWPLSAGSAGTVVPYCSGTIFILGVGPLDFQVAKSLTRGGIDGEFVAVSVNI